MNQIVSQTVSKKKDRESFDTSIKKLEEELDAIITKYQGLGYALSNALMQGVIMHLVHKMRPNFFEGLGYLMYRGNDIYKNEYEIKINNPNQKR